jgi:hypothetical protein
LGYINDDNEWECEDECLTSKGELFCGNTDHFTSFAVLLDGGGSGGGSNDPCASSSRDLLISWLSLAAVSCACLVIILTICAAEIRFRKKLHNKAKEFKRISDRTSAYSKN